MAKTIVYTTESCPWCKKVKEFLTENKISFKEVNVGENEKAAQEAVKKSGQMGVPVVDVDGTIIIGFDKPALKKALKLK